MDKINFRKQLDLLQSRKEAITQCSSRKSSKHIVNTMLNTIKDAIQTVERLTIPAALEAERAKTIAIINDAQAQITREHSASPFNRNMIETISLEMERQVNRIRDELKHFDSQGLKWIDGNVSS